VKEIVVPFLRSRGHLCNQEVEAGSSEFKL
jgi:hypothetical protein